MIEFARCKGRAECVESLLFALPYLASHVATLAYLLAIIHEPFIAYAYLSFASGSVRNKMDVSGGKIRPKNFMLHLYSYERSYG